MDKEPRKAEVKRPKRWKARHLVYLAFRLGDVTFAFPSYAQTRWWIAEREECLPGHIESSVTEIAQLVHGLDQQGGPHTAKARRIERLARMAWRLFQEQWGNDAHRDAIFKKEQEHGDYSWTAFFVSSPFADPVWTKLQKEMLAFGKNLPAALGQWFNLGAMLSQFLTTPYADEDLPWLLPKLQVLLSEMRDHPLLRGLEVDLTQKRYADYATTVARQDCRSWTMWILEETASLYNALVPRFLDSQVAKGERTGILELSGIEYAMRLKAKNPDWSETKIASEAGIDRSTLYRHPEYQRLKNEFKREAKGRRPRGVHTTNKDGVKELEGVDADRNDDRDSDDDSN